MRHSVTASTVVPFSVRTEPGAHKSNDTRQVGLTAQAHALVSDEEKREFMVVLAGYMDEVLDNRVRTIEQRVLGERTAPRPPRTRLFKVIEGGRN